jgi:hypothetical protein
LFDYFSNLKDQKPRGGDQPTVAQVAFTCATAVQVGELMSMSVSVSVVRLVGPLVLVHSPTHRDKGDWYLPWLATIWSAVERVCEAQTLWCTATERVDKMLDKLATTDPAAGHAAAALQALDKLPWDCRLKGFKASPSMKDLALWFTTDWLNTDHKDYMLELLTTDLGLSDGSTSSIKTTYFVQALEWAYSDPNAYRSGAHF